MADTPLNRACSARRSWRMVNSGCGGWRWCGDAAKRGRAARGSPAWPEPALLGVADRVAQALVVFLVVLGIGRLHPRGEGVAVDVGGDLHSLLAQLSARGFSGFFAV